MYIYVYNVLCAGGPASVSTLPVLWGHSAVKGDGDRILLTGGTNGSVVDSLFQLQVPLSLTCSLAQTASECDTIPSCRVCASRTDNVFLGCFNSSSVLTDSRTCNGSDRTLLPESTQCLLRDPQAVCSQYSQCSQCLGTHTARELGCVWCSCQVGMCASSPQNCPCGTSYSEVSNACFLDVCSYPSCRDCLNDSSCAWISPQVTQNPVYPTRLTILPVSVEWGCYSKQINNLITGRFSIDFSLDVCLLPCSHATSCRDCVQATSPNAGPLTCVWASYSQTCMSTDVIPLFCSCGLCGRILTAQQECPVPCSAHVQCETCLHDPHCVWYRNATDYGHCTDTIHTADYYSNTFSTVESQFNNETRLLYSSSSAPSNFTDSNDHRAYYFECPRCPNDCSGRGLCVHSDLRCACSVGFIGEDCGVECECNGHSYCANGTEAGRRHCLECLHHTQVSTTATSLGMVDVRCVCFV